MLYLFTANLEKGRDDEYHKFMVKNLATYKKHHPRGSTLKGVYLRSFMIGDFDVTWIWEFKKYADFDAWIKFSDPVFDKLVSKELDFYVPGSLKGTVLYEVK